MNNNNHNKTITAIALVAVVASLFSYTGSLTYEVFGQSTDISSDNSNNNNDNNDNNSAAVTTPKANNQDSINYPNFIDCLSESEETMGIATETDIKDCVGEIHGSSANAGSSVNSNINDDNYDGNTDDSLKSNNTIDIWPIPQ